MVYISVKENQWEHIHSNQDIIFIIFHEKRGGEAIQKNEYENRVGISGKQNTSVNSKSLLKSFLSAIHKLRSYKIVKFSNPIFNPTIPVQMYMYKIFFVFKIVFFELCV